MATMEESKLVISLDCHDEGPVVAFSRDKPKGRESQPDLRIGMDLDLSQGHRSFLPHPPSSPGSLADLSALSDGLLVTNSLVKSSSSDLDPSESSSPRGRPLLSLVKSLSTEVSWRTEPEVNLSMSDSKLHLHPWKQHPRIPEAKPEAGEAAERDDWAVAPSEPRSSSLIAELEGKRRKFSEAMQDQLSMLSKMIGEESCSISKPGRASSVGDSPVFQSSCERDGGGEDPAVRCRRRTDGEHKGVYEPPVKKPQQGSLTDEAVSCGMIELRNGSRGRTSTHSRVHPPLHWLFLVGLIAYSFFVLPLPPYLTGLFVGVMCGVMLGLGAMFTFVPQRSPAKTTRGLAQEPLLDQLRGERAGAESLAVKIPRVPR